MNGSLALPSAAIFRTDGSMSPNTSTHLPCASAAISDTPVMFPPGRAKLAIRSCFDGVGDDCDNGNIPRRLLCGARAWCVESNEDVDLCRDQFGRQLGKQFESSLRRANVE